MINLFLASLLVSILSMFLSLAEASVAGFSRHKAYGLSKQSLYGATHLLRLDKCRPRVLSTIIMLNAIVNIGGCLWLGDLASKVFFGVYYAYFIGGLTMFMLLFSEIKPKVFASSCPEKVARYLSGVLLLLTALFRPLICFVELLIGGGRQVEHLTEHEVRSIISEAKSAGLFSASESKVITNVLNLGKAKTEVVVTRDGKVATVDISSTVGEFEDEAIRLRYKRVIAVNKQGFPVGVLLVSDVLSASVQGRKDSCVAEFIYPLTSATTDCVLSDLLVKLIRSKTHLAVVVDEEGSLVGVVTLSNIVEELIQ